MSGPFVRLHLDDDDEGVHAIMMSSMPLPWSRAVDSIRADGAWADDEELGSGGHSVPAFTPKLRGPVGFVDSIAEKVEFTRLRTCGL